MRHTDLILPIFLLVEQIENGVLQYLPGVEVGVCPVPDEVVRQDHRHPIVDEGDAVRRLPREDGEHRPAGLDAVDARHVEQCAACGPDGVLCLCFASPFPLKVVGRGHGAPALAHAVGEHRPGFRRLAAGIDDAPAVRQRVSPLHGERRGRHVFVVGNDGHDVRGKDFAGGLDRLDGDAAIDRLNDPAQLNGLPPVVDPVSAAHHRHPPILLIIISHKNDSIHPFSTTVGFLYSDSARSLQGSL